MDSAIGPTTAPIKAVYWARVVNPPPANSSWKLDGKNIPLWGLQTLRAKEFRFFDGRGNQLIKRTPFDLEVTGAVAFEYTQDEHDPFDGGSGYGGGGGGINNAQFPAGLGPDVTPQDSTVTPILPVLVSGGLAVGNNFFPRVLPIFTGNGGMRYVPVGGSNLGAYQEFFWNNDGSLITRNQGNFALSLPMGGKDSNGIGRMMRTDGKGRLCTTTEGGRDWNGGASNAGINASFTKIAAGLGVSNILDQLVVSIRSIAAVQVSTSVIVRDGASGVGGILWAAELSVPNVIGSIDRIVIPVGLGIKGSANTAMTIEFGAFSAGTVASIAEIIQAAGYTADT